MVWGMRRKKAAIRDDRTEPYEDAIYFSLSEAGGRIHRARLIQLVSKELSGVPGMGNIAWHTNRLVAFLVRMGRLRREKGIISLASTPGAQLTR